MPSPIAHTTMGYVIHRIYQARRPRQSLGRLGPLPGLLITAAGLSLLPDIDSVAGFLLGDFGRHHNNGSHSLFVGLAVALAIGGLVWWIKRSGFVDWFVLVLLCYQFHIVLDFFTVGRGVMLFWPVSPARFESPVKLFYGLHWSDGVVSVNHIWTLLSELGFAVLAVLTMHFLVQRMTHFKSVRRFSNRSSESVPEEG
jgi:inner membrane protein